MYSPPPCSLVNLIQNQGKNWKEILILFLFFFFFNVQYSRYNSARIKNSDLTEIGSKGYERHVAVNIKVHLTMLCPESKGKGKFQRMLSIQQSSRFLFSTILLTGKGSNGGYNPPLRKYDNRDSTVMAWVINRKMSAKMGANYSVSGLSYPQWQQAGRRRYQSRKWESGARASLWEQEQACACAHTRNLNKAQESCHVDLN